MGEARHRERTKRDHDKKNEGLGQNPQESGNEHEVWLRVYVRDGGALGCLPSP